MNDFVLLVIIGVILFIGFILAFFYTCIESFLKNKGWWPIDRGTDQINRTQLKITRQLEKEIISTVKENYAKPVVSVEIGSMEDEDIITINSEIDPTFPKVNLIVQYHRLSFRLVMKRETVVKDDRFNGARLFLIKKDRKLGYDELNQFSLPGALNLTFELYSDNQELGELFVNNTLYESILRKNEDELREVEITGFKSKIAILVEFDKCYVGNFPNYWEFLSVLTDIPKNV